MKGIQSGFFEARGFVLKGLYYKELPSKNLRLNLNACTFLVLFMSVGSEKNNFRRTFFNYDSLKLNFV